MKQRRLVKHSEVKEKVRGGSVRLTKHSRVKHPRDYSQSDQDCDYSSQSEVEEVPNVAKSVTRPRGRPRKNAGEISGPRPRGRPRLRHNRSFTESAESERGE